MPDHLLTAVKIGAVPVMPSPQAASTANVLSCSRTVLLSLAAPSIGIPITRPCR